MLFCNRSLQSLRSIEMTRLWIPLLLLALSGCGPRPSQSSHKSLGRQEILWDNDWRFTLSDPNGAEALEFDDTDWQQVSLPHDWMIQQKPDPNAPSGTAGGYFPGGVGWYRKILPLDEQQRDRKVTLHLDGAYRRATVYVNGKPIGTRDYGYVSYSYDISRALHIGPDNLIAIRVDGSIQPIDRWYSGCGLFRHVRLTQHEPLYIPSGGLTVTTPWISDDTAQIKIRTQVYNDTPYLIPYRLETSLINPKGKVIVKLSSDSSLPPGGRDTEEQQTTFNKPQLWDPDSPQLYRAVSKIYYREEPVDEIETRFGIRTVAFKADSGFWLNERPVKLKGVCLHHDGGVLGAAVPTAVWRRRLEILKHMGVNAVRLAHNPHAPEVLELCDELGLLVYDEIYDKWRKPWQTEEHWSTEQIDQYQSSFDKRWQQDLEDFITRDRNHPSVILWSVGNETMEQLQDPNEGVLILKSLAGRVHELDPTREVTCALHPHGEFPSRLIHHVDVVSYNYQTAAMVDLQQQDPAYRWLSSETKAVQFEAPEDWTTVDFSRNSWFSLNNGIAGQFIWTGIDYLGESPGWPSKGFPGGLLETTGFKKPYAYFTESLYRDDPMVHITVMDSNLAQQRSQQKTWQDSWYGPPLVDHWTFADSQTKEVYVFTNTDEVELRLNNRSLGKRILKDSPDRVLRWQVPYETGTLKAVALQQGKMVAEHQLVTAGPAHHLKLNTDHPKLQADGRDVAHIEVQVVDEAGTCDPDFNQDIQVQVTGAGHLLALDNGDLCDQTPPQSHTRSASNGRLLIMIQSDASPGNIELTVSADDLPNALIALHSGSF